MPTAESIETRGHTATDELLEELCSSFGSELLPERINPYNGTKAVRLSRPVVLIDSEGQSRILQAQYTRFSPLHSYRYVDVYNRNRSMERGKRKISKGSVNREIEKQHQSWNPRLEMTDTRYIKYLEVARWEKEVYFAVYDLAREPEEELVPFLIHEEIELDRRLPSLHITLHHEPSFLIGEFRRETGDELYDTLRVSFPETQYQHNQALDSALLLHPVNKLGDGSEFPLFKRDLKRFGEYFEIHSSVPEELTMGLIRGYLRRFCLGKEFY